MTSDTIFLQPLSRLLGTSPASDFGLYGAQPVPGSLPLDTAMAIAPDRHSPDQGGAEEAHIVAASLQGVDSSYSSAAFVTDAPPTPLVMGMSAGHSNTASAAVVIAQSDAAKGLGSSEQLFQAIWLGDGPSAANSASTANQTDIGPIATQGPVATPASPDNLGQNGAFSSAIVSQTASLPSEVAAALLPTGTEPDAGLVTVPVAQLQVPALAETATNLIQLPLDVVAAGGLVAPLLGSVPASIGDTVTAVMTPVLEATTAVAEVARIVPAETIVAPLLENVGDALEHSVSAAVAPVLEVATSVAALAPTIAPVEASVEVIAEAGQVLAPVAEALEPPLSGAAPLLTTVTDAVSPLVEEPLQDMLGSDPAAGIQTVVSLVSAADVIDLRQAVGAEGSAATQNPLGEMLDTLASDGPLQPLDDVFDLGLSHNGFGSLGGDDLLGLGL